MHVDGKRVYLRLLGHVAPHWRLFAIAIAAMVVLATTQPALAAGSVPDCGIVAIGSAHDGP